LILTKFFIYLHREHSRKKVFYSRTMTFDAGLY